MTKITNVLGVGDECGSVVTLREGIVPSFARVGAFVHFVRRRFASAPGAVRDLRLVVRMSSVAPEKKHDVKLIARTEILEKGRNSPAPRLLERVFAVVARGFEVAAGAPACVAAGAGAAADAEEVAGGERGRQVFLALSLRGVGVDAAMMMIRVGKICEIFGGELPRSARHRRRRHLEPRLLMRGASLERMMSRD